MELKGIELVQRAQGTGRRLPRELGGGGVAQNLGKVAQREERKEERARGQLGFGHLEWGWVDSNGGIVGYIS